MSFTLHDLDDSSGRVTEFPFYPLTLTHPPIYLLTYQVCKGSGMAQDSVMRKTGSSPLKEFAEKMGNG